VADARDVAFSEPGTGRRPGRPRDTNSDETRARILEAALDAFAERGYDGVSTREIARHAEVTSATVYHHFPSKFSLYQDAHRYALDVAFGAYAQAVAGHDSVMAEIDAMLDCSLRLMHERVAITSLAIHAQTDAVHPEMHPPQLHDSARAVIDGMTQRAVERGELDAADAVLFERMLVVFLWGLAMAGIDDEAQRVECVDAIKRLLAGTLLRSPER
jgi:AcrR family transcriptional regulator